MNDILIDSDVDDLAWVTDWRLAACPCVCAVSGVKLVQL